MTAGLTGFWMGLRPLQSSSPTAFGATPVLAACAAGVVTEVSPSVSVALANSTASPETRQARRSLRMPASSARSSSISFARLTPPWHKIYGSEKGTPQVLGHGLVNPGQLTEPGTWVVRSSFGSSSCCGTGGRGADGCGAGRTRAGANARPAARPANGSTGSRYR